MTRRLPRIPQLLVGLVLVYMLTTIIVSLAGRGGWLLVGLVVAYVAAGLGLYLVWPKERTHPLNHWQKPDTATRLGLIARSGARCLLMLVAVAGFSALLFLRPDTVEAFYRATGLIMVVMFVWVFWDTVRHYSASGTDGLLRYRDREKPGWRERLFVGAIYSGIMIAGLQLLPMLGL